MPGVPYLDKITFKPISDDSVRVTALRSKEIDVADELPYSTVAEAKKSNPGYNIVAWDAAARRRINLNTRIPPFNDVRVRQAVAYAIDKKELAEGLAWGFGEPINQRYPKNSKWFINLPHRQQSLEKAKALLAEAGHKDGLRVKAPVYPGPDMEFTTVVKDQLKKAGINLEFDVMDWAAHSKLRREHKHTLYAAGMGLRPDPDQVYYADLHSKSRNNNSGYSNPEVDRLLEQARRTNDSAERKRLYIEVLKFVERDLPEIYVYMAPKFLGVQPHVKGFTTGSLEDLFYYVGGGIQYTWLDR
jgi:peptide/nickel transport system substrate-binding protein